MQRRRSQLTAGTREVLGIRLIPGLNSTWIGSINGRRFVVRRSASGGKDSPRTFAAYALPAVDPKAAPVATAANVETLVGQLIDLYKRVLPL